MAITLTYITTLTSTTNATTYDFGDVAIPGDGCVVVLASGRRGANRTLASVSIGGTNGTRHVYNSAVHNPCAIVTRTVTAGNRNITVVCDSDLLRAAASVWLMTGHDSETPVDTDEFSTTSNNRTLTIDYPTDGVGVYGNHHASAESSAWSAASERYDETQEAGSQHTVADKTASGAGNTESVSWATVVTNSSVAAVWAPAGGGFINSPFQSSVFHSPVFHSRVVRAS